MSGIACIAASVALLVAVHRRRSAVTLPRDWPSPHYGGLQRPDRLLRKSGGFERLGLGLKSECQLGDLSLTDPDEVELVPVDRHSAALALPSPMDGRRR
jgi:hypothetical protein